MFSLHPHGSRLLGFSARTGRDGVIQDGLFAGRGVMSMGWLGSCPLSMGGRQSSEIGSIMIYTAN